MPSNDKNEFTFFIEVNIYVHTRVKYTKLYNQLVLAHEAAFTSDWIFFLNAAIHFFLSHIPIIYYFFCGGLKQKTISSKKL